MKRNGKRGFTIVELVVVIAVVAILAAVLIPTFASVIKKANVSNDLVLVKELNDGLKLEEVGGKKNDTMTDALNVAKDYGFEVEKLTPRSSGEILWDSVNNRFVLLDENGDAVYKDESKMLSSGANLWKIVNNATEAANNTKYSSYIKGNATIDTLTVTNGVDVGENIVKELTYENTKGTAKTVTIRTNGGNLTVNAPSDTVNHYSVAEKVTINDIAAESYHEFGFVTSYIKIDKGHIVIEGGASVSIVAVNGASVSLEQKSGSELFKVRPVGSVTISTEKIKVDNDKIGAPIASEDALSSMEYGGGNGIDGSPYELYTASHVVAFANDVNKGVYDGNYVYAKLCDDVDISGMGWEPIGNLEHPFFGSFTGAKNP
ncbi:MAG: prepilin-type N-terminal cleavage/methylation domain-containing protein, partial [Candidatus Borkfalkiaceae bacterium]|nr:prepilin-type N-terminal cleavage/methylation domain-containing protein [Christensenellaceae bacterium]